MSELNEHIASIRAEIARQNDARREAERAPETDQTEPFRHTHNPSLEALTGTRSLLKPRSIHDIIADSNARSKKGERER